MKSSIISILLLVSSFVTFGNSTVRINYSNNITRKATPQLTVPQYKNKVQSLLLEVNKLVQNSNTPIKNTRLKKNKKTVTPHDAMVAELRQIRIITNKAIPLYSQIIALNPPKSLAASHTKLKKGAQSSLDLLYLTNNFISQLENPSRMTNEEFIRILGELQLKLNELQNNSHPMLEAIFEISGAN